MLGFEHDVYNDFLIFSVKLYLQSVLPVEVVFGKFCLLFHRII